MASFFSRTTATVIRWEAIASCRFLLAVALRSSTIREGTAGPRGALSLKVTTRGQNIALSRTVHRLVPRLTERIAEGKCPPDNGRQNGVVQAEALPPRKRWQGQVSPTGYSLHMISVAASENILFSPRMPNHYVTCVLGVPETSPFL